MKASRKVQFEKFMVEADPKFLAWVNKVSPVGDDGVQEVFIEEALMVLKLLMMIFEFLKTTGWFSGLLTNFKTKRAMKQSTILKKEAALKLIVPS